MTGLEPSTTYHYRLVAVVNGDAVVGGDTVAGADETFTTEPEPTVVTTGSANWADPDTGATVTGTINPKGVDTQYHFEYGTQGPVPQLSGASWIWYPGDLREARQCLSRRAISETRCKCPPARKS